MFNKYFSSTAICPMSQQKISSVVLSDVLTGNGLNYRMHSVIVDDNMDTAIYNLPYAREQRCKLFQNRNVQHMTLPIKVDNRNIQMIYSKNENYTKEF